MKIFKLHKFFMCVLTVSIGTSCFGFDQTACTRKSGERRMDTAKDCPKALTATELGELKNKGSFNRKGRIFSLGTDPNNKNSMLGGLRVVSKLAAKAHYDASTKSGANVTCRYSFTAVGSKEERCFSVTTQAKNAPSRPGMSPSSRPANLPPSDLPPPLRPGRSPSLSHIPPRDMPPSLPTQ